MNPLYLGMFVFVIASSCSNTVTTTYDNGSPQCIIVNCDEPDCLDTITYYFENGIVSRKVTSKNNLYEGMDSSYHDNGALQRTSFYVNGRKEGIEMAYEIDGKIESEHIYKNDTVVLRALYMNGVVSDLVFITSKKVDGSVIVVDSLISRPVLTDAIVDYYVDSLTVK